MSGTPYARVRVRQGEATGVRHIEALVGDGVVCELPAQGLRWTAKPGEPPVLSIDLIVESTDIETIDLTGMTVPSEEPN